MDQDETWHGDRPPPRPHCVRWGPSSPPQKRGHSPQFSAHVCCGQTAGWIRMPLDMEVGLSRSHIVLDGDPAPPPKKRAHSPPQFSAQDQDFTWYDGRPWPRRHCRQPIPLFSWPYYQLSKRCPVTVILHYCYRQIFMP